MNSVQLQVSGLGKRFDRRRVLGDFSLTATGGEVVVIRGENGSGKSTLLKMIAGVLRPTKGRIVFTRNGIEAYEAEDRRRMVGYAAPDLLFYPELSALENLRFFDRLRGRRRTDEDFAAHLQDVGLRGRERDPVAAFSSGMRQRLRLCFAKMAEAPVLLLDEPSLALDENGVGLVAELIKWQRSRGGLTLLATNDAREAALGDRVVALSGGIGQIAPEQSELREAGR